MIIYKPNDNIFKTKCEAAVNPVNCIGICGAGLALQFKLKYPSNFLFYRTTCRSYKMSTRKVLTFIQPEESIKYIINFPTKLHWKNSSKMEYIEEGLLDLKKTIQANKINSIAIPMLGCGLGDLKWKEVEPIIVNMLEDLIDVEIELYGPQIS
jgi:O-acetyl-ADP-ribose deacetylase (regulator of RNase III)